MRRYGQGLIFRLRPGGALYVFEIMYLINVLVAGAVGLVLVNILMDFVVKYLLPGGVATLMNAKKSEIVSKANRGYRRSDVHLMLGPVLVSNASTQ